MTLPPRAEPSVSLAFDLTLMGSETGYQLDARRQTLSSYAFRVRHERTVAVRFHLQTFDHWRFEWRPHEAMTWSLADFNSPDSHAGWRPSPSPIRSAWLETSGREAKLEFVPLERDRAVRVLARWFVQRVVLVRLRHRRDVTSEQIKTWLTERGWVASWMAVREELLLLTGNARGPARLGMTGEHTWALTPWFVLDDARNAPSVTPREGKALFKVCFGARASYWEGRAQRVGLEAVSAEMKRLEPSVKLRAQVAGMVLPVQINERLTVRSLPPATNATKVHPAPLEFDPLLEDGVVFAVLADATLHRWESLLLLGGVLMLEDTHGERPAPVRERWWLQVREVMHSHLRNDPGGHGPRYCIGNVGQRILDGLR